MPHLAQVLRDQRVSFFLEQHEGKCGILGCQRRAVMEARAVAQVKDEPVAACRDFGAFRNKPVNRIRLVIGASHQRVENEIEALRRVTLENVAVERVEG